LTPFVARIAPCQQREAEVKIIAESVKSQTAAADVDLPLLAE
jgi:hypothetical protein